METDRQTDTKWRETKRDRKEEIFGCQRHVSFVGHKNYRERERERGGERGEREREREREEREREERERERERRERERDENS